MLRRRRELVILSAELQRTTIVRRLDNVGRHPAQAVLGFVTSVASVPLLLKLGSVVVRRLMRRKREARAVARRGKASIVSMALPLLRFIPVLRTFPVLKFLNR
jgi:hypothetical protein